MAAIEEPRFLNTLKDRVKEHKKTCNYAREYLIKDYALLQVRTWEEMKKQFPTRTHADTGDEVITVGITHYTKEFFSKIAGKKYYLSITNAKGDVGHKGKITVHDFMTEWPTYRNRVYYKLVTIAGLNYDGDENIRTSDGSFQRYVLPSLFKPVARGSTSYEEVKVVRRNTESQHLQGMSADFMYFDEATQITDEQAIMTTQRIADDVVDAIGSSILQSEAMIRAAGMERSVDMESVHFELKPIDDEQRDEIENEEAKKRREKAEKEFGIKGDDLINALKDLK